MIGELIQQMITLGSGTRLLLLAFLPSFGEYMPTNPILPTLAQVIEEVKKQNWGHEQNPTVGHYCIHCKAHIASAKAVCPTRIARAQQVAVAEALRWAAYGVAVKPTKSTTIKYLSEAAKAIEKELEDANRIGKSSM